MLLKVISHATLRAPSDLFEPSFSYIAALPPHHDEGSIFSFVDEYHDDISMQNQNNYDTRDGP